MRTTPSKPSKRFLAACSAAGAAVAVLATAGCAATAPAAGSAAAAPEWEEPLQPLRRDHEASLDRERALAERLRRAEESIAQLQAQAAAGEERLAALGSRSDTAAASPAAPAPAPFDAAAAYARARSQHQERRFEAAVAAFAELVERAPDSDLADNAHYWMGEAYYVQGRFRPALAQFTKVLGYERTEKADDAQLMIARTYLSLGEREQAVDAFRRLLDNHADSEYADEARKELRYLEGP